MHYRVLCPLLCTNGLGSQDVPLCKARGVPLLLDSSSCRVSALCFSSAPPPLLPSLRASKECETLNLKPSFYWKDRAVPLPPA